MKIKQVRETPTEDLLAQVKAAQRQILEAKVKKTSSDVQSNPLKVRTLRRDVARMLTVVRERELQK
ncbi:MAG: 50S ribosomal protein L29 [Kiritimatiellae bacterium]|nr:50S ribosomal protein L29 [Kiritimatiellia bacterium]MBR1836641.1 50S ribosomal protein L29 [Kiritimatiellia bacterium]